jgi:hypothetical protein
MAGGRYPADGNGREDMSGDGLEIDGITELFPAVGKYFKVCVWQRGCF